MLTVVIFFLWASILLYVLLGGADFGAGILELLSPSRERMLTRQLTVKAIGPIWEANHMWLVITVVILFVGFPAIYTTASISLHIPLLILLLGIIARGTALAFRSNDAIKDDLQLLYSRVFVAASVTAPFCMGVIAGSFLGGYINPEAVSAWEAYVDSWLHWLPVALGVFTECICAWLASIYLIGRSDTEEDKRIFIQHATIAHITLPVAGILIILAGYADQLALIQSLPGNSVSLLAIGAAGIVYFGIWRLLLRGLRRSQSSWLLPGLAVLMVTLIYFSVTCDLFPDVVILKNERSISLTAAVNRQSITALGWALLIGSGLIFPSLFYLIHIFEGRTNETSV